MTLHSFLSTRRALRGTLLCATVCATALSLTLAGCGGGGSSGPSTRATGTAIISPKTTPTPAPTAQIASCSRTYTPNYKGSVTLLRWTNFPLRVYFPRDTNYSAARQKIATDGFNKWVTATNNGGAYTIVTDKAQANVTVTFFQFTGAAGDTLGQTNISYYRESRTIESTTIELGVTGGQINDVLTAAHEYGHNLGISGHSPSNEDLMYFEGNDAKCGCITPSDLNTLLTGYCGNFPRNARSAPHAGPLESITIE